MRGTGQRLRGLTGPHSMLLLMSACKCSVQKGTDTVGVRACVASGGKFNICKVLDSIDRQMDGQGHTPTNTHTVGGAVS